MNPQMNPLREGRLSFYRWFDHAGAKAIPPILAMPSEPHSEYPAVCAAWREGWNKGAKEVGFGHALRYTPPSS